MTVGNLKNKVVSSEFHPKCENCKLYFECKVSPKHDVFPHTWHWGWEGETLSDGSKVVEVSWVGTIGIGEDHTGCYSYEVADDQLIEPNQKHLRVLEIKKQLRDIEQQLSRFEEGEIEDDDILWETVDPLYDKWDQLFKELQEIIGGIR